jgi:glycosyltransferase involved in cell wall biosynthesis
MFMADILFVAPYPVSRIRIRLYGFIMQLSIRHNLTVIALCTNERDIEDTYSLQKNGIAVILVLEKRLYQYFRGLRALISGLPFQIEFGAARSLRAAISEQLTSGQFDLMHVEFIRALGALPASLSIPVVWDAVDCVSQLYEQGAHFGATRMLRIIGRSEAQRIRDYELKQLQRFQHVLVTSERDRQALLALSRDSLDVATRKTIAEITVLPHGIDQRYFQQYTGIRQHETLIFSGKMSFHANVAGALNLVERIMPHIWKQRPTTRLVIAGSDPPPRVRRLACNPHVEVTGYLPDLRPYIARAQVAVCPLPYAVGIQNKVLEAMALGTPVVASSSASAGLQVVPSRDLLVADDPEAFAAATLRLLDNQELWNKLADAGLAYVTAYHNWESILEQLDSIYAQVIERANSKDII